MNKGKLLVISGPSGVGKDTIVRLFLSKHPDWRRPVSLTTRKMRTGEKDGQDYIFVSRSDFEDRIKNGDFLEWINYTDNLYGTLKDPVEKLLRTGSNILLRVDIQGALHIKQEIPGATIICLLPDKIDTLEQRFRARATDSESLTRARLKLAREELAHKDEFDHLIVNPPDHPERALREVEEAVGT